MADARNARIVEISAAGGVLRTLDVAALPDNTRLCDPHDVRAVGADRLLIVDAASNLVMICDWFGQVLRLIGGDGEMRLSDPHSAQLLENGDLLIADSGNSRIVRVGESGAIVAEFETFVADGRQLRLAKPRYAEVAPDGTLVVADSDNNRVLAANAGGELQWELDRIPDSPIPILRQPRWVQAIGCDEVVVSDHLHHRILHLRRLAG